MAVSLSKRLCAFAVATSISLFAAQPAFATSFMLADVGIASVMVHGGADTTNPGTTCIKVSVPVAAACLGGWVAINNNNKLLISASMQAKATGGKGAFYYDDAAGSFHCPGNVFTPCSVISIELK